MIVETRDIPLQTREAPIQRADADKRTFDVTWSTGAKVRRWDWLRERYYDESLSLEPAHVRMQRLSSGRAPVLDSHDAWRGLDGVLGVVQAASLHPTAAPATLRMSQRAAGFAQDVADGIISNVSVGYRVHRYEMLPPAANGDVWEYRAIDWEPHEISLVAIGADAGAGVRALGGPGGKPDDNIRTFACEFINPADSPANTQEHPMIRLFASTLGVKVEKDATDAAVRSAVIAHLGLKADATDDELVVAFGQRSTPATTAAGQPDAVAQARADEQAAERKRTASLITLCAKHNAGAEFQARAISEGWSEERTGLEILNERAAKGANLGPTNTHASGESHVRSTSSWDHTVKKFGGK